MDNQQNQPGTPMPGSDIRVENATTSSSTTGQASAGTPGSTTGSQRKTASARGQGSTGASGRSGAQGSESRQSGQEGREGQQSEGNLLNTALESGKKWIEDSHVLDSVNQLPQNVKDWSNRAVTRVGGLTTTQKVVGGAILAAGLGWLALRKGKSSSSSTSVYGRQGNTNAGYGRKSGYGYQSTESSNRRPAATGGRSTSPSFENSTNQGSDRRNAGGYGGASSSDYGSRTSESGRSTDSSYRSGDDYRSIE